MKQTFTQMMTRGEIDLEIPRHAKTFGLFECVHILGEPGPYSDVSDHESNTAAPIAALAFEIARVHFTLRKLRYPEAVFKGPLTEYEGQLLRFLDHLITESEPDWNQIWDSVIVFQKKIVAASMRYRRQKAPHLPIVFWDQNECGAGEISIYVRTEPANGRVFFIPVFYFRLCEAQKIDPHNQGVCNFWREATVTEEIGVAGDYFYVASWPDGAVRRGKLRFQKLQDGERVTFKKK